MRLWIAFAFTGILVAAPADPPAADVKPETLAAFQAYVGRRESALERDRLKGSRFLWIDDEAGRAGQVRAGKVLTEAFSGKAATEAPGGLIHDWIGAAFVPGATVDRTLALLQNYDNHKVVYRPEVIDSKLLGRDGDTFRGYLRLRKHKVITVVLNTEHEARFFKLDATHAHSRSRSTKIAEVSDPGTAKEQEKPPGKDHGFLWRLNSYWRILERDGGVYIECEAISLTRGIPSGFGWLISPIVRDLPRESLESTLRSTRDALTGK